MAKKEKKPATNPKKGKGRPRKPFKDEYCDLLIEHMASGLSFESFGGVIGVCKATLYKWSKEKDKKEFLYAKKIAEEKCRLYWEEQGNKGMWGGKNFNPAVWIFNMRNRFKWRDDPKDDDEEGTGEDSGLKVSISYDPKPKSD